MITKQNHPVDHLRVLMEAVSPYPPGVIPIPAAVAHTSFFPGGTGIWNTASGKPTPPMPTGGFMILGHDYDSEAGYQKTFLRGSENLDGPTWGNLLKLLRRVNISPKDCFFTNFFMGLRVGKVAMGIFPGRGDTEFVKRCRHFLSQQLEFQRPRLVVTLGAHVPHLIALMSSRLSPWNNAKTFRRIDCNDQSVLTEVSFNQDFTTTFAALTHPCYRQLNVRTRQYRGEQGEAAELLMLADAIAFSQRSP